MVAAVRDGASQRSVARRFGVSLATVQLWLGRSAGRPLDTVDWVDRPPIAAHVGRTATEIETLVVETRRRLREESVLGEYGAAAIRRELTGLDTLAGPVPSVRTIGRILERRGALDARRRVRRPAPPPGWYLPDLRARRSELDSFDFIDGLWLRGGIPIDVLTGISLHGALAAAWPASGLRSGQAADLIEAHWRTVGKPRYAQFDNDARFIGGASVRDSIGTIIRFCLAAAVTPVFAPPRETGFQAAVEAFNGRWQRKLWLRFWNPSLPELQDRSAAYIGAVRRAAAVRIEAAPGRDPIPAGGPDRPVRTGVRAPRLPASDQRRGRGHDPQPGLPGRPPLGAPPGPGRAPHRCRAHRRLRPAPPRTGGPAPHRADPVRAASALVHLTGMVWHLRDRPPFRSDREGLSLGQFRLESR